MTLARYQNRCCSPTADVTIYGWGTSKKLYRGKLKAKNSQIEMGLNSHLISLWLRQPLQKIGIACVQEESSTCTFSHWREREEKNVHQIFLLFRGLPKRLVSVSPEPEWWWNLDAWEMQRAKQNSTVVELPPKPAVLKIDNSGSMRLQAHGENQQTSLIGKFHTEAQRRYISIKGLRPKDFYLGRLVKVFPCTKPVHKQ